MKRGLPAWVAVFGSLTGGIAAAIAGCGDDGTSVFTPGGGANDGGGGQTDGPGGLFGDSPVGDGRVCQGLECRQVPCSGGAKTTVTGTVYDPAGKVPLYNVIVYVPNGQPKALSQGASCDQCAAAVTGNPIAITLTDSKGKFTLENVPIGGDVPIVFQIGKWRRQTKIPGSVGACVETAITDKEVTRLPRNQSEGDIPRMALTTGGADPLECLIRKIGIDDVEFTAPNGGGRIHMYRGSGYATIGSDGGADPRPPSGQFTAALNGGAAFGQAQNLWDDVNKLKAYDLLLTACEGDPDRNVETKPQAALDAVFQYANLGGRVFASHYHDYWLDRTNLPLVNPPNPTPTATFPQTGTWIDPYVVQRPTSPALGTIDTTFPKGAAFKDWLQNVGGLQPDGRIRIFEPGQLLTAVAPVSQQWITLPNDNDSNRQTVQYMTFNTPVGVDAGAQCGRVVYNNLHVSSGDLPGQPFPQGCVQQNLSDQEKALEFLLFDLSACIQDDRKPPDIPK
jgi:hypothetical protein